jgi:serine/threonine-protein kinase
MSSAARINELLEEILETDRAPEDVCATCPELLDEVRRRLEHIGGVKLQLDSLFPLSETRTGVAGTAAVRGELDLPAVHDHEILSVLGRGGMGVVYRARHTKLNRIVALKMLLAGSHAGRQEHARFMREAAAVAALRHPNVVQIYDFGESAGQPYFTMEYVGGGSLAFRLSNSPYGVREAAELMTQVAQAVGAAHRAGIVHRDLKPANILLADDGRPKIGDFGLARRIDGADDLTQTGMLMGTPNYMAPEQMTGGAKAAGPPADLFALGSILYEMLAGRPPFRGDSFSDIQRRLVYEEPERPSRVNAKVPRDLETICLKCLEKIPHNRYASADELAADLERFLRFEPIRARPVGPAERGVRWVRRNPLLAALAVTGVVLVGLLVGDALREAALSAGRRTEKARLTARIESGIQLAQSGRFAEARAILGELGDGGFDDLRRRIDRALADLALVEELDAVGMNRALAMIGREEGARPAAAAAEKYAIVFQKAGLGTVADDPDVVARQVVALEIEAASAAALDDWAVCEPDEARRNRLLEVARRLDPDPAGTRNRLRRPEVWRDPTTLSRAAEEPFPADTSVPFLRALADRMAAAGLDSIPFRRRIQREHVDHFIANVSLADALRPGDPAESIRYYQAALAIRPHALSARNNLAVALAASGGTDEAIRLFQEALEIDSRSARVRYNLGRTLFDGKRYREAETQLRQALELLPANDPEQAVVAELLERARNSK